MNERSFESLVIDVLDDLALFHLEPPCGEALCPAVVNAEGSDCVDYYECLRRGHMIKLLDQLRKEYCDDCADF